MIGYIAGYQDSDLISQDIRTVDIASDCLIAYLGMINYSIDNILHYPCVELQSVREGINKIIKKRHKPF